MPASVAVAAEAAEVDDARGDWQQPALSSADTPANGDGRYGPDLVNVFAAYVPKVVDVVLTLDDLSKVDFASFGIGGAGSDFAKRDGHFVATVQVYDAGRRFGPLKLVQVLAESERTVACKDALVNPQGEQTIAVTVPTTCLDIKNAKGRQARLLAVLPRVGRYTAADRRSVWQFDSIDKPMIVRRDKPTDPCSASGSFGC
ncbi:MAG: hypothetical protein ACT4QF_07445 [Sporichthyaceae bacterium]